MNALGAAAEWVLALGLVLYGLVAGLVCAGIALVFLIGIFANVVVAVGDKLRPGRTEVRGLEAWARWFVS